MTSSRQLMTAALVLTGAGVLITPAGTAAGQSAPAARMTPAEAAAADPWLKRPVDDATFRTFLDFYSYDATLPLELREHGREEKDGLVVRRLSYQSTPTQRVTALFFSTAAGDADRPTLVMLHGGAAAGKDEPSYVLRAQESVRSGFNVLIFDMLHFGERRTDLLRTHRNEEKHEQLYNKPATYRDWVIQVAVDARRAVDLLTSELGVDPGRIGLLGYSRGGILGHVVGAVEPRFRAVAILLGGHMDALEQSHLAPVCPANFIGRISPRPLLLVGGDYDADHIRETSLEPLAKLARQPVTVVWGATGHMILPEHDELVVSWFREHLR